MKRKNKSVIQHKNPTIKLDKNVERLKIASGKVTDDRLLVGFLYLLMRDVVPAGFIEMIMLELSNSHDYETAQNKSFEFTNGWLASYCQDLANRFRQNIKTKDDIEDPKFSQRLRKRGSR